MAINPFSNPKLKFVDMSKFPEAIRKRVSPEEMLNVLRATFDLLVSKTRKHERALEGTYQTLYHVTTDKLWDPATGESFRSYFLGLALPSCAELRFVPGDERKACAIFAHDRGKTSRSPEDWAIRHEEEPDREREDAERRALGPAILAAIEHHKLATDVARIWAEHGDVPPRTIAEMLAVPRSAVYDAIELIRYHAYKACRNQGDKS